jgi:translocation and assembly module TamB
VSRAKVWLRWRKWASVLAFFAIGIPVSTAAVTRSAGVQARLHTLAAGAIHDALGLDAQIGRVSLQLVPLTLVGRDLVLDDPVYGRFAEARELRIEPSLRGLLRGRVDLHRIEIAGARLHLVVRNGQVRNLPRAEGPPPQAGGPLLPFAELRVLDSTVIVDADPYATAQLEGIEARVSEREGAIRAELVRASGWARHRNGRDTIDALSASVSVTPDREVRVQRLSLLSDVLTIRVRDARVPLPVAEAGCAGEVRVSYDLEHLARVPFPPEVRLPRLRGRVTVAARVTSDAERARAAGTVDLAGVRIEQFGIGETAQLRFAADRDLVRILPGSTVAIPREGGALEVEGDIALAPEWGFPTNVVARAREMSFGGLMSDLGVTDNAIVEWMFNGELALNGVLVPLALEGPVDLRTHDFRVTQGPYHERPIRRMLSVTEGHFQGRWSIRPDAVRFEDLVATLPRSRLRADVHLGFDNRLGVNARAEHVDLADITPLGQWPIAGIGEALVTIEGSFQTPHVVGDLRLDDFVFDDFSLGSVASRAELDPDGMAVRFPMVTALKNGRSPYRAEDLYLNFRDQRFAMGGQIHLDGMTLEDFYDVFGLREDERFTAYQGLMRGHAAVSYTNGYPQDSPSGTLDVEMSLAFPWASLNDYRFTDGLLEGRWRWLDWSRGANGAELELRHVSLRKGAGVVTLDGRMDLGGQLRLEALADRISLRELEGVGDRFPDLDGVASVIGHVGGTFDVMRADFDVALDNLTYEGRSLGDGRFFARLTDRDDPWVLAARGWDRTTFSDGAVSSEAGRLAEPPCAAARSGLAHADWPADPPVRTVDGPQERLSRPMAFLVCGRGLDGRLAVDLAIGRTEVLPLRGRLALDGLDLGPFLPQPADGRAVTGGLTGELAFERGAMREPESLEGVVRLSELRVAQGELELRNDRRVDLVFKSGRLEVMRARFVGPDSALRVRGYATVDDGLALQVDADVNLAVVERLSTSVTGSAGRLEAALSLTGPPADPELYGQATLSGGSLRLAAFDSPIENLSARVEFSQRSVLLEELSAEVAGGRVSARGEAELREQELERYRVDVVADDLRQVLSDDIDVTFGARARLEWSRGQRLPLLGGEIAVAQLTYGRGMELRGLLGEVAARATQGVFRRERTEVREYDPNEDSVQLDLRVTQSEPFRIQNNLVDAEVRIQADERPFRIVGTDQRYGLQGTMELSRGRLFFQNNAFDVRRGIVRFEDPTRIDPRVDIEAITEVRRASDLSAPSWRVMLSLTGPSDGLRLRTQSEPALPEQDILMLLAFGMTSGELQQLQQGGDLASAAAIEAISAITGVDREVRRALPLIDDLRVTTGYSTRTGRSEPRISVGRRIADRVRLSATTGLSESRDVRASLEVQLDESQRIGVSYDNYNNTSANSLGNLGIDWGIRLDFE